MGGLRGYPAYNGRAESHPGFWILVWSWATLFSRPARGWHHRPLQRLPSPPRAVVMGRTSSSLIGSGKMQMEGRSRGEGVGGHSFSLHFRFQVETQLRDRAGLFLMCGKGSTVFSHFCRFDRPSPEMTPRHYCQRQRARPSLPPYLAAAKRSSIV